MAAMAGESQPLEERTSTHAWINLNVENSFKIVIDCIVNTEHLSDTKFDIRKNTEYLALSGLIRRAGKILPNTGYKKARYSVNL